MNADLESVKRDHSIVDELARRGIRHARAFGNQVTYLCPLPGHEDTDPSFTVKKDTNTFRCFGCDRSGSIIDLIALLDNRDPADVIRELTGGGRGYRTPPCTPAHVHTCKKTTTAKATATTAATPEAPAGCTIAALADRCQLPVDYLKSYGLTDMSYMGAPAVRIPYPDTKGREAAVQYRVRLDKSNDGERFKWKRGSKPTLYGWTHLPDALAAGRLVIVEGASDLWTLRRHGIPALALPAANGWRDEYADALADIPDIFVVIEPDQGGQTVRQSLKGSGLRDQVKLIYMTEEAGDPNDLYRKDPDGFPAAFAALMAAAVPLAAELHQETTEEAAAAWERCRELAALPRILDHFIASLHSRGVAGEDRLCKLLYLALVSRRLKRPVSVAVKGPSSGGKSYVIDQVLAYFPATAYFTLSAMSDRALAYMEEPLAHRHLVLYEAAGMAGDMATYLIRSLLSEGCIRYVTVEKTTDGLHERLIEREGPTGLIVTTTRITLHPENETRLLSLTVTDTPEQTRSVFRAIAEESEDQDDEGLVEWRALQTWLDLGGEHRVTIPYATQLAELIPPVAVRLRRDFTMVLNLIRAHALLHQATRERDDQGKIIATIDDYAVVRDLVADMVADEVGATVTESTRETVRVVRELHAQHDAPLSRKVIAAKLGIDPSAASRRLKVAEAKGYIVNLQTKERAEAKWIPGEPLPDDEELLPPPERVQVCTCAGVIEGIDNPPSPHAEKVTV
jgi:hypothetical protein